MNSNARLNKRGKLPRTVVIIGLVSLLNDFASEMVVPLIPLLLATVLMGGPVALGLIEGMADTVSNLLKLWAGRHSDLYGRRRKPYVVAGYPLSNLVRPLIGISGSWLTVLAIRVTDRVGKGVRTAPRDALVSDAIDEHNAGHAYGFTRALDHTGAVLGALAAAAIVYWGTPRLDVVIALSAIPGLLAVSLVVFGIKEPAHPDGVNAERAPLSWSRLSPVTRRYLAVIAFFTLGKIPETFLLLRGHELGMTVVELLLLWAAMHMVKATVSGQAGTADRPRRAPAADSHRLDGLCHHFIFPGLRDPAADALGLEPGARFLLRPDRGRGARAGARPRRARRARHGVRLVSHARGNHGHSGRVATGRTVGDLRRQNRVSGVQRTGCSCHGRILAMGGNQTTN